MRVGRTTWHGVHGWQLGCYGDHRKAVIEVMEDYFRWLEREISGSYFTWQDCEGLLGGQQRIMSSSRDTLDTGRILRPAELRKFYEGGYTIWRATPKSFWDGSD